MTTNLRRYGSPKSVQAPQGDQPADQSAQPASQAQVDPTTQAPMPMPTPANLSGPVPNQQGYIGGADSAGGIANRFAQNLNNVQNQGTGIQNNMQGAQDRYAGSEQNAQNQNTEDFNQLRQTPGYTSDEASKIAPDYTKLQTSQGDLNNRYLTQDEQTGIEGTPYSNMDAYNPDALRDMQQTSQGKQEAATGQLQQGLNDSIDPSQLQQSSGYQQKVGGALQGEAGSVNSALSDSQLSLDPNFRQQYQMSDKDVQDQVNSADRSVANRYQSEKDANTEAAAADGNTSPAALAAMNSKLAQQQAVGSADAMTDASISAKNAQAQRLATGQQMQLGAAQNLSQQKTSAAENLGQQQVGAANTGEQMRTADQQYLTGADLQAATTGGQAAIGTADRTGQEQQSVGQYVQDTGEKLLGADEAAAQQRSAQLATNRQAATANVQDTGFNQGVTANQDTAAGNQNVANQRIAGQTAVRNNDTSQQQMAQQGFSNAAQTQVGAYGTQTNGANQAAAGAGSYELGQKTSLSGAAQAGLQAAAMFFKDGGVTTKPTNAILGENGPEQVIDLSQPQQPSQPGGAPPPTPPPPQPQPYGQTQPPAQPADDSQNNAPQKTVNQPIMGRYGAGQKFNNSIGGKLLNKAFAPKNGTDHDQSIPTDDSAAVSGAETAGAGAEAGLADAFLENGAVITKPTRAVLSEHGQPEAVIPLSPSRNAKLMPGDFMLKSRYRTPTKPQAPVKNDLPLVSGRTYR